jgi:putative aldouronate transport system permease protein
MAAIAFICIAPIIHVLFASISDPAMLMKNKGIILWPLGHPTIQGYVKVFQNENIISGYANTLIYVSLGTGLNMILTVLGGYALSRKKLLWKNLIMFLIVFTMWFSGGLVPTYMVVYKLGLIDTRSAVILPTAMSAFNLIIMRTGFSGIHASIEEASKIDGAGDFITLFKIMIPLNKAVIAVIALFYLVFNWNQWFNALIYLPNKRQLYPLQLILREILIKNDLSSMVTAEAGKTNEQDLYRQLVKYSTVIVATLPILCIYPFVQKYFVKGFMIGSVKG